MRRGSRGEHLPVVSTVTRFVEREHGVRFNIVRGEHPSGGAVRDADNRACVEHSVDLEWRGGLCDIVGWRGKGLGVTYFC